MSSLRRYIKGFFLLLVLLPVFLSSQVTAAFRFASLSDAHLGTPKITQAISQINSMNTPPVFYIFNGDLENDGVADSEFTTGINAFSSVIGKMFLVRGNHDDHQSNSAALWQSRIGAINRSQPAGITNYTGINSTSTYLTYSFDYENSRFIGVDVPGDADLITQAQLNFIDQRLTDAENRGLTHAFIYWHGPEYCVGSIHCGCQTKNASGCTPASIVSVFNKHPILSATFHGHEHIAAWVHMDSSRIAGITHPYEEFLTSSVGNPYSFTVYQSRVDFAGETSKAAFGIVDVDGPSFTVSLYNTGNNTPIFTKTFTKTVPATPTPSGGGLQGDLDGNGTVDIFDYNILVSDFGKSGLPGFIAADINTDGKADIFDYNILVENFGRSA